MKIELIKTWNDIKIYLIKSPNVDESGEILMSKFITKNKSEIVCTKFGKPYLGNKKIWFNLSHTNGYAALAVSKNKEIGLDIERLDRGTGYRSLLMSKFNLQFYTKLKSHKEFVKQWTIRESAIKCYGDLTLNSIYRIETNDNQNILKCEGKEDLEYSVFFHDEICICISRKQ
jgi:phosphopantetheinyl transferase